MCGILPQPHDPSETTTNPKNCLVPGIKLQGGCFGVHARGVPSWHVTTRAVIEIGRFDALLRGIHIVEKSLAGSTFGNDTCVAFSILC